MKIKQLTVFLLLGLAFAACNGQTEEKKVASETSEPKKEEAKMTTIPLNKIDFLKKVANYEANPKEWKYLGDKPAVIDFYADWCGPCKVIAPMLEELAAEYGDQIYIYKVNVDNEQELAGLFGIRSIPSLLFIPMEGQPQMTQGAASKAELKTSIDKHLFKK